MNDLVDVAMKFGIRAGGNFFDVFKIRPDFGVLFPKVCRVVPSSIR